MPVKPIDDFEVLKHDEPSRFHQPGQTPEGWHVYSGPPNHPLMGDQSTDWMGDWYAYRKLAYRGTAIKDIGIASDNLVAQFETERCYLLLVDEPPEEGGSYWLFIYYLPEDFSGAELGQVFVRPPGEFEGAAADFRQALADWLRLPSPPPLETSNGVAQVVIEDDRHIKFRLRRGGRFRISLYEDRPRRFRLSTLAFWQLNSLPWEPRFYTVWRTCRMVGEDVTGWTAGGSAKPLPPGETG